MSGVLQDLRFGARSLARNYRTTIIAVLSLALGIGAVTSIYCTISAVLMNPVPFPQADRIVHLFDSIKGRGDSFTSSSYADFMDYQDGLRDQFENLAAFSPMDLNFTGPDGPERLRAVGATSGFFPLLRVQMVVGRGMSPESDKLGAAGEAVISEALWKRAYGARKDIVGSAILLDGESYTVCGVAPESFRFVMCGPTEVWTSINVFKDSLRIEGNRWLIVWGRIHDGVSRAQAEQAYQALVQRLVEKRPATNAGREGRLAGPGELMLRDFRPALLLLMGAVAFVLLIACVNVANLLLANAAGRRKEIAIRAALGATRGRVIRQLLTESALLALLGGALGVLVALWGNSAIVYLMPAETRDFYAKYFQFGIRGGVLMFTLAISLLTGLLFGLAPALEASKQELAETLKEGGRGGGGGVRRHRLLSTLVVSEVALALVLLVGAGLLTQSLRNVYSANPGFESKNLLTFFVGIPRSLWEDRQAAAAAFTRMEDRLRQLGGVTAVGAAQIIPFSNDNSTTWISIEGRPEASPDKHPFAGYRVITPGYFEALGVPVVAGRNFTRDDALPATYWEEEKARRAADVAASSNKFSSSSPKEPDKDEPVVECEVIINETAAKEWWPGEDALGKRVTQGPVQESRRWLRVVGVVKDFHEQNLGRPVDPEIFLANAERPSMEMYFVMRGTGAVEALVPDVRKAVQELNPNQAIGYVKTMKKNIEDLSWFNMFIVGILGAFAVIALLLSAVGVYGVINCSVSQRTHEIGVRMALGANPAHVQKMIVKQGMKLALAGGLIGSACALGLMRLLQDMLYGVGAADPATFIGVALVLLLVAAAASWIPARKATKVNPVVALRYE